MPTTTKKHSTTAKPSTTKPTTPSDAAQRRIVASIQEACDEADRELYGAYCAGFSQALAGTSCAGLSPSDTLDVHEVVAYTMGLTHGTVARAQPGDAIDMMSSLRDVVAGVADYMATR